MYVVTFKFIKVMQFKQMLVTAVCVLFLLKLKWPKSKSFYEAFDKLWVPTMGHLIAIAKSCSRSGTGDLTIESNKLRILNWNF